MTRYDLLKMNTSVLQIFINNKIDIKDIESLHIFEEYIDMRNKGLKFAHVISSLAQKYHCSERKVAYIADRMRADIKV